MSKHIELVKKWLADNESVSRLELEANVNAAWDAAAAAQVDAAAANATANAAYANAAYVNAACVAAAYDSAYLVAKYHEEIKEERP
jgi:hypothetical protein